MTADPKKRFAKRAIHLLGHSYRRALARISLGSELGILAILQSPDDDSALVGVGQVVSNSSLERARLSWLNTDVKELLSSEDRTRISRIRPGQPVSIAYVKKYGGCIHNITPAELQSIMGSPPCRPEEYTAERYDRGWDMSEKMCEKEIVNIDFAKQAPRIPVSVFFFLGRYDFVTPTAPVLDYIRTLEAPHKEMIWFEESGHRVDVEEHEKFQQTLIDELLD